MGRISTIAILMLAIGCGYSGAGGQTAKPLELLQITPESALIQGEPLSEVEVELQIANNTDKPLEISPLSMSCSCQIGKSPQTTIPAHGIEKFQVKLRIPPFGMKSEQVEIRDRSANLILSHTIILESIKQAPYFTSVPARIEIPWMEGVSEGLWEASVTTWEEVGSKPYLSEVRIDPPHPQLTVETKLNDDFPPGIRQSLRTCTLQFHMGDWSEASLGKDSIQSNVILQLSDSTERSIPLSIKPQKPLGFVFDARSGVLRGVRRGGASGTVRVLPYPRECGSLTPDQFEAGDAIVSQFKKGKSELRGVDAVQECAMGPVQISIRFRNE